MVISYGQFHLLVWCMLFLTQLSKFMLSLCESLKIFSNPTWSFMVSVYNIATNVGNANTTFYTTCFKANLRLFINCVHMNGWSSGQKIKPTITHLVNSWHGLLLVFILGSVLEYARELHVVEEPVAYRRLAQHLVDVVVGEPVTHCSQQFAQTLLIDHTCVLFIEASAKIFLFSLPLFGYKLFHTERGHYIFENFVCFKILIDMAVNEKHFSCTTC